MLPECGDDPGLSAILEDSGVVAAVAYVNDGVRPRGGRAQGPRLRRGLTWQAGRTLRRPALLVGLGMGYDHPMKPLFTILAALLGTVAFGMRTARRSK